MSCWELYADEWMLLMKKLLLFLLLMGWGSWSWADFQVATVEEEEGLGAFNFGGRDGKS